MLWNISRTWPKQRAWVTCGMSRRLLKLQKRDIRGGEGVASLHRCEEWRMLRLPVIIWFMLGRAWLNVTTTNGTLSDSCLMFFYEGVASLKKAYSVKRWLYPLLMRCVVSALRRLLKKSSVLILCLRSFRSFPEGCWKNFLFPLVFRI